MLVELMLIYALVCACYWALWAVAPTLQLNYMIHPEYSDALFMLNVLVLSGSGDD